ncbi:MAG: heavy-metal-associated domain-containing protein [Bacteroidales bacterium]|nr:heavy-metal-associated domain-containing protein [Bacteroidales bacterium]MDY6406001.1 heavy-metal-associated domain-containing protein [Bacteroidales bacterium]
MKKFLYILLCSLCIVPLSLSAKANKQVVVLSVDIHCQGCIDKIMKNIAFEKGVKDIVCDLDTKTVTVTYDANKTDVPTLLKAFEKIGKPATVKEQERQETRGKSNETDANTGASTPY